MGNLKPVPAGKITFHTATGAPFIYDIEADGSYSLAMRYEHRA